MYCDTNIITFYWDGIDRPGWSDFCLGAEYINRLYRGICRNMSIPFEFHCFTNVSDMTPLLEKGINVKKLVPHSWRGCLPKLEAHSSINQAGMSGRIIVFDLDTVIVGDLTDICTYKEKPFITRAWFKGIPQGTWLSGGDLLSFDVGATNYLYERYSLRPKSVEEWTGGRERFVYREWAKEIDYWQRVLPTQIVSYKNHIMRTRKLPKNARVVSCHGNPRPHQMWDQKWIQENWI
jgi:hypothetical protein